MQMLCGSTLKSNFDGSWVSLIEVGGTPRPTGWAWRAQDQRLKVHERFATPFLTSGRATPKNHDQTDPPPFDGGRCDSQADISGVVPRQSTLGEHSIAFSC